METGPTNVKHGGHTASHNMSCCAVDGKPYDSRRTRQYLRSMVFMQSDEIPALSDAVSVEAVAAEVENGLPDTITQRDLMRMCARTAAAMSARHPDYGSLAGRVETMLLWDDVPLSHGKLVDRLLSHRVDDAAAPLIAPWFADLARQHAERIAHELRPMRDLRFDYFAMRTLQRGYLLRSRDGQPMERPQHMYMRVALAVHREDIEAAMQAYHDMSRGLYTHASPTMYHAGTAVQQLSSCYLLGIGEDSIDGIYGTLGDCARISKTAGGIGLHVSNVRGTKSYIRGTQGHSNGLVPMLRVFNATARYVDQGGGRRRGAVAIYIEPWHRDILAVLKLKQNQGPEDARARDLFYALWVPDLFMERVRDDANWTLLCPAACPGLADAYGDEFRRLYEHYETYCEGAETVKAQALWKAILESQIETGGPYMLYKDACNAKSNQRALGCIKSSNLCTEIVQYTSREEVAVCNLGSIGLPRFVRDNTVDFDALHAAAQRLTVALDRVIDANCYPLEAARRSNRRHRPIGIGVQGLADVFAELGEPYDSPRARELNSHIFETIYHGALTASCALAQRHGTYDSYAGSPASQGLLQHDLWAPTPETPQYDTPALRIDWGPLRADIARHGLRNSLLTAPMPTASTAQIMGNTESFEPPTSNVFVRRVLSGEFVVVNRRLVAALESTGQWDAVRRQLLASHGSVQGLSVPDDLKAVFRTAWEISQKHVLQMAADRGRFIDQSQSMNIFMADASAQRLTAMHMYGWRLGLKTGMYYLHTRPAVEAIMFAGGADSEVPGRGGEQQGGPSNSSNRGESDDSNASASGGSGLAEQPVCDSCGA